MTLTIQELKTEHLFSGKWITDKTIPVDKKKSPICGLGGYRNYPALSVQ